MTLPLLYKKAKTGKITQCLIYTEGATVITETGYIDGVQTKHTYDALPKNPGRSNATTAEQQAIVEAQAKHVKNLKSKYVTDPSGETTQRLPRKVGTYQDLFVSDKTMEKLNTTFYVENKYNGVNGTYRGTSLELTSRGGEQFPLIEHQTYSIIDVMEHFGLPSINVEQYIHGMHLQDIQSAVTKTNSDSSKLVAVIFAFPDTPGDYESHIELKHQVKDYCVLQGYHHIDVSLPVKVEALPDGYRDFARVDKLHANAILLGYEGIIVANGSDVYEYNERSSNIWKYKIAMDAEFLIVGYELDKKGNPKLICSSNGGNFTVRPTGDQASRDVMKLELDSLIGQWYKCQFECYSKLGKPTKPVGIGVRKCDFNGKPLI